MAKRSRTQGKADANPSRSSPARSTTRSFNIVLSVINGEFDGPELVAIYQAAHLRLLETSPALLIDAQNALLGAHDQIARLIAPE